MPSCLRVSLSLFAARKYIFNFVLKSFAIDPILQTGAALLGFAVMSAQRIASMASSTAVRVHVFLFFPSSASPKAGFFVTDDQSSTGA